MRGKYTNAGSSVASPYDLVTGISGKTNLIFSNCFPRDPSGSFAGVLLVRG
jgi:hypothetical protein